jgi:hypothetical protein
MFCLDSQVEPVRLHARLLDCITDGNFPLVSRFMVPESLRIVVRLYVFFIVG